MLHRPTIPGKNNRSHYRYIRLQRPSYRRMAAFLYLHRHMYEALRFFINDYASTTLDDATFDVVKAAFVQKKLRRKQYLLQEGEVCKYIGFILKGAMRQYSVDEKGGEHIVELAQENWWVGDRESYYMLTPSRYNIDALEACELLLITNADLQNLIDTVPAMGKMLRILDQRNAIATQHRLHATLSYTAEERYNDFLQKYPTALQRFPLHMIASYLGVSAETLSRIRKQAPKK